MSEGMQEYLPEDPLPGQIIEVPEGVDGGSATHITLQHEDKIIGETQQLLKIENVSRKWQVGRTHTIIPIKPETELRVRAVIKHYASLIFVEYLGWVGHKYKKEETILSDRIYEVLHTAIYMSVANGPHIYELIGLNMIDKGETK